MPPLYTAPKAETLDDVMKWAFYQDKSVGIYCTNVKVLLKYLKTHSPKDTVDIFFPKLRKVDRAQLIKMLAPQKQRVARIHSREVLMFMRDLIDHRSTAPPPWVT